MRSAKCAKPQRPTTVAILVICCLCSSLVCCFLLFVEGSRAGLCWADCRAPRGILCAPWQDVKGLGAWSFLKLQDSKRQRFLWTQVISGSKIRNNQMHISDRKLAGVWRSHTLTTQITALFTQVLTCSHTSCSLNCLRMMILYFTCCCWCGCCRYCRCCKRDWQCGRCGKLIFFVLLGHNGDFMNQKAFLIIQVSDMSCWPHQLRMYLKSGVGLLLSCRIDLGMNSQPVFSCLGACSVCPSLGNFLERNSVPPQWVEMYRMLQVYTSVLQVVNSQDILKICRGTEMHT